MSSRREGHGMPDGQKGRISSVTPPSDSVATSHTTNASACEQPSVDRVLRYWRLFPRFDSLKAELRLPFHDSFCWCDAKMQAVRTDLCWALGPHKMNRGQPLFEHGMLLDLQRCTQEGVHLSLIHISEPTRRTPISY